MIEAWIGVDLDGTLAEYDDNFDPESIGPPVELMYNRVIDWIERGKKVKIMTARAGTPEGVKIVEHWLEEHGLGGLEVTNVKDYGMVCLYDDRCRQVIKNTGLIVGE